MASKRALKKDMHNAIAEVVEKAYSFQLYNPGKKDKEVEALIDQSVDTLNDATQKINSARNLNDSKEIKKHFDQLKEDFMKEHDKLTKEVKKLG